MPTVDEVREALDRTVPSFAGRTGDWAGVLEQARSGARAGRARTTWWPAVGVATVAAAAALVLLWPAGHGGEGIVARAQAAAAGGPVVHVVLREPPVQVYDLARNEYRSLPARREQWYDRTRGLHETETIGSKVFENMEFPAEYLERHPQVASVMAAYRRALAADKATLGPEDTVEGHRVYWIRFRVEYPLGRIARHEVAVDAETFEPRYLRIDGGPVATVLSYEALQRGEGAFAMPRPVANPTAAGDALWSQASRVGLRSPAEARAALKGALWLGPQFRSLRLASIREVERETGNPRGILPRSVRALELCYGTDDQCAVSVALATIGHPLGAFGHGLSFDPPPGTLAFGDEPGVGFLIRDGVHVAIVARNRDELIEAAKALTPIP